MKMMFSVILVFAMVPLTSPAVSFSGSMDVLGHILSFVDFFTSAKVIQHPESGKCLNIERNLFAPGVRVILWDCNWGFNMPVNERFKFNKAGEGLLLSGGQGILSGLAKCIYTGNEKEDPLFTIDCNSGDKRQQFQFGNVRDNLFLIKQVASGRCLRAMSNGNEAWIRAVDCNEGDKQQIWKFCKFDGTCG